MKMLAVVSVAAYCRKTKELVGFAGRDPGTAHSGLDKNLPLYHDSDPAKIDMGHPADDCYWVYVPLLEYGCFPLEMIYRAKKKGEKDELGFMRETWVQGPAIVDFPDPMDHESCKYVYRDRNRGSYNYCFETQEQLDAYRSLSRLAPRYNDRSSLLAHSVYANGFSQAREHINKLYAGLEPPLPMLPFDKRAGERAERKGRLSFFLRSTQTYMPNDR